MASFERLFSSIEIGGLEIKNRIFFPGHHTNLTGRNPSPEIAAYFEARAKGGAGLIIVEMTGVYEPGGIYSSAVLMATDDECIPGFRDIAERCHAHDCKVFAQLFHPGREIRQSPDGTMALAYAPSAVPTERFRVTPAPFTDTMIRGLVEGYGNATARLERAGLDGVEVIIGFGFVLSQFLSPRINRRDDSYGGSFENRFRIVEEVFASIRGRTNGMVLGVRISIDERNAEGLTADEVAEVCEAMERTGQVDYFNLTDGSATTLGAAAYMVPSMSLDHSALYERAGGLRKRLSKAILLAGRLNQPQLAEQMLADGTADMCGMARPLIADPELPNKAKGGRADDIRACVACNQSCIGRVHKGSGVSCIHNPLSGRETEFGGLAPATKAKTILVVGGGPAGMKAAAMAAERGHHVALWEATSRLGGQVRTAEKLPGRAEFGGIVTNLASEIARAGVDVSLDTRASAKTIRGYGADVVIIATGATARAADIEPDNNARVVDAWSVANGQANVGQRVLVYDWLSDWTGLGIAEKLAMDGCTVTLAVNGCMAGEQLPVYTRDPWVGNLHRLGVEIVPYARLYGADSETVYLQHMASGEAMIMENVDTLVTSLGGVANDSFGDELADLEAKVHLIGDCLAPRSCQEAILDGFRLGAAI